MHYYITEENLTTFVGRLRNKALVIGPVEEWGQKHLEEIKADKPQTIDLAGYRTIETFKAAFFKVSEKVAAYFGGVNDAKTDQVILIGARGCDLEGIEVLDRVYLEGEFSDPGYARERKNKIIISADCTSCGRTCFCTMVGGKPFPTKLFDLNLSKIKGGDLVETGTEKGEELISSEADLFVPADEEKVRERNELREKVEAELETVNRDFKCRCTIDWAEAHKINLENTKAWRTLTKDCVECSSCNFTCPTCSCFLLLDQPEADNSGRYKIWDACLKDGYARVAGGANSRPLLSERLQNRYHCKFDYSRDRLGRYTCVGCGRCIDGCAGNIDMRKVYAELVRQVPLTAKLE
jgi:hypothetical protein